MNPQPDLLAFLPLFIWSLLWKGIALWRAAKQNQKNWFVVMLVVSTFGILEIVYLLFFSTKKLTFKEIKTWNPFQKGS